jgi:hypothetical protein
VKSWRRLVSAAIALCLCMTANWQGATLSVAADWDSAPGSGLGAAALEGDSPLLREPEFAFNNNACQTTDLALDHARDLRRSAGLEYGPSTITASVSDPAYRCSEFGILMTDAERAEFARVLDAQGELSSLAVEVSGDPSFAGAYLQGSTLTIASTDGRLGELLRPVHGLARRTKVNHTWADLQRLAKEIDTDTLEGQVVATRVSVNPMTNKVDVGVSGSVEEARKLLFARYGAMVAVHDEPLTDDSFLCNVNDCGTKGGLTADHSSPSAGCTTGFVVQAKKGWSGTWSRYMMTAGHCIDNAGGVGNSNPWKNGVGATWGTSRAQDFWSHECGFWIKCISNDIGLFAVGATTSPRHRYVIGTSDVPINHATKSASQLVGQIVYRHGRSSALDSGAINDIPVYRSFSCGLYTCRQYGVVKVNMASLGGDSGSGFYRLYSSGGTTYRSAYGILSGGPHGQSPTYYTSWNTHWSADRAGSTLDAQDGTPGNRWYAEVCITSGCALRTD